LIRIAIAALAALVAAAPQPAVAQDRIAVVTTTADLKSLVEAVGRDRVEVESLATPEQDPHSVEIKPGQLSRLRRAQLLVKIGLDHEPWLARLPAVQIEVVDASKSVRLLQTETPRLRTERRAHVHSFGNTHYWLDPGNAGPITASIRDALARLRPADKELFAANRDAFMSRLNERIKDWEAALAPYRGVKVVVMHDSWAYFADRFGLQIVAAAEPHPGIPPSPAELAALFRRMRDTGVPILIAAPYANPALVRQIEEKGGAKAVMLLSSSFDYIGLFEDNVRRLTAALKKG
jgi:ABC-type Zn uptake system ZnuABC Zn-binding protein ZnuA